MILHSPFTITSRLMAGVQIGDAVISIGYSRRNQEGRICYQVFIDLDGMEYEVSDLESGCQGGTLQEGMESLLSFLTAAGESYGYRLHTGCEGDNEDLFEPALVEWAYQNSDDISMLAHEIEETPRLIEE